MPKPYVEVGDYEVCTDCYLYAMTGDATAFDGAYCEPEASERLAAVEAGLDAITEELPIGHFAIVDGEESWFSWSRCECCASPLGGDRQTLQYVRVYHGR
jgi:hypothetical protein